MHIGPHWPVSRILSSVYRLSAIRQLSGFRTVSDEAASGHIGRRNEEDILPPSRIPGTIGSYKSGGTKDFHAQMVVTISFDGTFIYGVFFSAKKMLPSYKVHEKNCRPALL